MLSLKEVHISSHVKYHNDIPRFNIKKSHLHRYGISNRNEKDTRPTLDEFIRNFERVYKSHRVHIKNHWFFHLESYFEKNDVDYSWFQQTIKVAYTEDGNPFTWENAKECLRKKFNNTSVIACNQVLFHYRQKGDRSLSEFMDYLMLLMTSAKINSENNFFYYALHQYFVHW
jgi:hypothetical protein